MEDPLAPFWADLSRSLAALEAASGNSQLFALQEIAHAIHYAEPKHLEHAATILGMTMTELGSDSIQSTTAYSDPSETDEPTTAL
jgi:hypothetical protein